MKIEVYSDVVCPWCFIGNARLATVLAERQEEATIVYRPFFLDPTTPEGGIETAKMLRQKYGRDPLPMFKNVEMAAAEAGVKIDFDKQRYSYPTVLAHTLIRLAADKGTQGPLVSALFGAYFTDGKNITDHAVLAAIGAEHGFAAGEVEAALKNSAELEKTSEEASLASRRGIRGVPFFVFGDAIAFSGAQPAEVFHQALDSASSERSKD
jgi:predicted DsbA family dithiol-disulfide isomerase